jgi:hypothetical protein
LNYLANALNEIGTFMLMPKILPLNFLLVCVLTLVFAPLSHVEWYKDEQAIMGTSIVAEVWSTDAAKAQKGIRAVMQEMHRIDYLMRSRVANRAGCHLSPFGSLQ